MASFPVINKYLAPTKTSFNRKTEELTVVCPYSEILLDNKRRNELPAIKAHRKKNP